MCILFLIADESIGEHYKLILAANRDEYYHRPARIAEPWAEDFNVYGGMYKFLKKLVKCCLIF